VTFNDLVEPMALAILSPYNTTLNPI